MQLFVDRWFQGLCIIVFCGCVTSSSTILLIESLLFDRNLETDLLLIATHFIEKDRENRSKKTRPAMSQSSSSRRQVLNMLLVVIF